MSRRFVVVLTPAQLLFVQAAVDYTIENSFGGDWKCPEHSRELALRERASNALANARIVRLALATALREVVG